jgi:hypothetical protein
LFLDHFHLIIFMLPTFCPRAQSSMLMCMVNRAASAVLARKPLKAEKAILVLIDGAREDIELVLATKRSLPKLGLPAKRLRAGVKVAAKADV